MAHLGAEVAEFVDGQLPVEQAAAVRRHLDACERCRQAVTDQRHVKRRMERTVAPAVPAHLTQTLTRLTAVDALPEPPRTRWHVQSAVVVMGASFAVILLAYLVGQGERLEGDPVKPAFDEYAAAFVADTAKTRSPDVATVAMATVGSTLSVRRLDQLSESGWPCHEELAGAFTRVDGHILEGSDVVALRYADSSERVRMHLVEQRGALARDELDGFRSVAALESRVWVREGVPTVVTWDADGLVFTMVTDAGWEQIEQLVAELPTPPADGDLVDRIGDGLHRMTSWVAAG